MNKAANVNWAKVEECTLALMHLTTFSEQGVYKSWKGFDWDVLDRLHARGWISSPATKAKSIVMSDDGRKRSEELFNRYFAQESPTHASS